MNIQEYNAQIIHEYLAYKSEVPKNTYRGILTDCRAIEKYLYDNNAMITSLFGTYSSEQFISFLSEKYNPATVKRRLCTLRSIIHWCQEQAYIPPENDINISENLEIPKQHFASNEDIKKLYNFCKCIDESDEYTIARAKLECLMVIMCGFKVSELKKLRIQDVVGSTIEDRVNMVRFNHSECIDTFLRLREKFTDLRLIKSDILFVTKYGTENKYMNVDYKIIREQCNLSNSVTLSSIRNSCIKECSIFLNNDTISAKIFDVTAKWLDIIRNQANNNKLNIKDDEMLLLEQYRKLTSAQKEEIIRLVTKK